MQILRLREDDLYVKMQKIGFGRSDYRRVLTRFDKMLRNEKYMGDVLLQKTFVEDLFSGKQVKNQGELEQCH